MCTQRTFLAVTVLLATSSAFTVPSAVATKSRTSRAQSNLRMVDAGIADTISGAWASYNEALDANPLLVKSVTAGVILGAADLTGQALEGLQREEDKPIDVARAVRFAVFGLILQAPWNHFYYQLLDGVLPPTEEPWTTTTAVKTVIDQFVQAPVFTVLIFAFLGFLEGKTSEDIKTQLKNDYPDTMVANCKFLCASYVIAAFAFKN